jgi:hypothetical protein
MNRVIQDALGGLWHLGFRDEIEKVAIRRTTPRPRVETGAIKRAKEAAKPTTPSPSLERALKKSHNQKPVLKKVMKSTEGVYMGGNTASDMRQVHREQQQEFRADLKKRLGQTRLDMRSNF